MMHSARFRSHALRLMLLLTTAYDAAQTDPLP
jgi:hypothetical protein